LLENFKKESERAHKGEIDKAYELPKAVAWTVGYERIVTTEVLFQPDILDFLSGTPGLDKLVFQAGLYFFPNLTSWLGPLAPPFSFSLGC